MQSTGASSSILRYMHIAIDARIISSSTGRYVERLLTYLQDLDENNHYSILVRKKDLDFWKPKNDNFQIVEADYANYSFSEQIGLLKLLNALKPDLVHFCMPQQPIFYRGNKVTSIHDLTLLKTYNSDKNWLVYHLKQAIGRFVFRSVVRHSRYIITISDTSKRELESRYTQARGKVIRTYLAAEMRTTEESEYPLPSKNFILYVGQQSDYKNVRRLGDAHQKLLSEHPDLYLILVGKIDGSAKRTKDYFDSKEYKQIIFTGFVEDNELNWLYTHTQAYIFPSLMEGFGLPGLEAMLKGAPVVSSNASCLPEIYQKAAHYFDPVKVDDMSHAINDVISNKDLRDRLVAAGNEQVAKFSWEKTAEETLTVYKKALKEN